MTRLGSLLVSVVLGTSLQAAPLLWIHDSRGILGKVDVPTGAVTVVGGMGVVMTDIAFDPSGNLYGLSFSGLYSINSSTGASTFIGNHGIPGGNALVFASDGTLYGAGASTNLYTVNKTTGAGSIVGNMGYASAGDLAFNAGNFYLASTSNQLIDVDPTTGAGSLVGNFGYGSVFGLATADNGVLYGLSGNTVFSVNTGTGAGTFVSTYAGGLGASYGSSFYTEAGAPDPEETVPEPSTLALFGVGIAGLIFARRRRRENRPPV